MTINGNLYQTNYKVERARGTGHSAVVLSGTLKSDDGIYPAGLYLAIDSSNVLIPYTEISNENIGTGDGNTKAFSGTLSAAPIWPGSLSITDGTETFDDDGYGHLTGDAGGTGTVNYKTGAVSVSFEANVTDGQAVTVSYNLKLVGILDEKIDTGETTACLFVVHGSVQAGVLKIGKTSSSSPTASQLAMLTQIGIYSE